MSFWEATTTSTNLAPMPLTRPLPDADPFPTEVLGPIGSQLAVLMHQIIQAPSALVGQSLLGAMNYVAQPHANVCIDGRVSPLSEFFLTLGESGERKSAADGWALAEIRNYQHKLTTESAAENERFQIALNIYESSYKSILHDKKLTSEQKQSKMERLIKPAAPKTPMLIVSEPSSEAIQRQLIVGLPSVGLFNDEGGQFLGGYAMSAEKRLGTLTTLSRLWDRGEFDRVRVTDGAGSYFGRRLNMHLMVQPGVASSLLADPLAKEQGFLARCLVSYPKTTAGTRSYVEADISETQAYKEYVARIRLLLANGWPVTAEGELQPRNLMLTPQAKNSWVQIYNDWESRLGPAGYYAPIRSLATKAPEHVARLAGTFAIFDQDNCIHEEHITRGMKLVLHYLEEAMRLWGNGHITPELIRAQELLAWLHANRKPEEVIKLTDVYRNGPSSIRNATAARETLKILVDHCWVLPHEHPTAKEAFIVLGHDAPKI